MVDSASLARIPLSTYNLSIMAFDTLATARALKEAGLDERQAEAIAEAIRSGEGDLARQSDIEMLKAEMETHKAEMKVELYKVALAVVAANAAITFGLPRFFNS